MRGDDVIAYSILTSGVELEILFFALQVVFLNRPSVVGIFHHIDKVKSCKRRQRDLDQAHMLESDWMSLSMSLESLTS